MSGLYGIAVRSLAGGGGLDRVLSGLYGIALRSLACRGYERSTLPFKTKRYELVVPA